MHTTDLAIFIQMVSMVKEQGLEYKILYSYHQRRAANGHTECYALLLLTHMFSVTYEENYVPLNTGVIKDFINFNNCIKVDFKIKPNLNAIELTDI